MFLQEAELTKAHKVQVGLTHSDQTVLWLLMELINLGSKPGPPQYKISTSKMFFLGIFCEPGSMLKALMERWVWWTLP